MKENVSGCFFLNTVYYNDTGYYYDSSLSYRSNGYAGHGFWCGAMVSIAHNTSQLVVI